MTGLQIALICIGCGICAALLIILFVWLNNSYLKTSGYEIEIEGLEKDIKVAHISDLHGKKFGKDNCKLIDRVADQKPDFIAITGDIIHKYREKDIKTALNLVSALQAVAPVLYVSGNHEMRSKGYRFLRRDLTEAGAVVLDDRAVDIRGLTVVGMNCASLKNDRIFEVTPDKNPKILLAHFPHFAEKYSKAGYNAVLCGHAHGGQWRIPFTDIGFYSPGQGLLPKLTSGVKTFGNTTLVISRGLGNSKCPLRLFNRPELVVVTFKGKGETGDIKKVK